MPTPNPAHPKAGETWTHTKSGKNYRIDKVGFDVAERRVIVGYVPLYPCEHPFFTRPLTLHPKAWDGKGEDGRPRFRRCN